MKRISPANFGGEGGKVRLTRKGRKPRATFYREPDQAPTFAPTQQDWREIELGYGHAISESLRLEIKEFFDDYLWFFHCKKSRSFAGDVITYLERIAKSAFPSGGLAKNPRKTAHKTARDVLLEYYLFDAVSPLEEGSAANFVTARERVASAARALVEDIGAHDMAQKRSKPDEWDKTVVRLMIALRSRGLPHTVNKRGTRKGASPVVNLLHELQDRLPAECRRHVGRDNEATDETMAAAASAAWVAFKRSAAGKYAQREEAKHQKAKSKGRNYATPERQERLNKVFSYLGKRRHRSLVRASAVAAPPKRPS